MRDQDRESVMWGERESVFSVCVRLLCNPPEAAIVEIYPFPPSELDLTRLHNICMGAAEFMYMVEGVCLREAVGCVCVFGGVEFCFGLSVLKSVRWAGYIKGRARCSCIAAGSAALL